MIDIHSHLMPGVDDGARDSEEATEGLRALHQAGADHVMATPHLDGSLTERTEALAVRLEQLDAAWQQLQDAAATLEARPALSRGAEIMLDSPAPDLSDARVRLAGTDFVLVEFPWLQIPPSAATALSRIRDTGCVPVVAHPERHRDAVGLLEDMGTWRRRGAYMQCNCGSLLGTYGPRVQRVAFELLSRGWIDYVASDYHARGPLPLARCAQELERIGGAELAELLLMVNPGRLHDNRAPLPVAPAARPDTFWQRVARAFR